MIEKRKLGFIFDFVFGMVFVFGLLSPLAGADGPKTFTPDAIWDSSQLAALQQAQILLQNLQSGKVCPTAPTKSGTGRLESCLDQNSDQLLQDVRNATALYPGLSASVILKSGCKGSTSGISSRVMPSGPAPRYMDENCVANHINSGLIQVQSAIIDIQSRSISRQDSAISGCREALNSMTSSNFDSLTTRKQQIESVLAQLPVPGATAAR